MDKRFIGVWDLDSFEITKDSETHPWGKNTSGMLIYTESGEVSFGINKDPERASGKRYEAIFNCILFYSGSFEVLSESEVCHKVQQASDPDRIGKSLKRKYRFLSDNKLQLEGSGEFGIAKLIWNRRHPV